MNWHERWPHWTGPTPEWPYPFPPIRGGDGNDGAENPFEGSGGGGGRDASRVTFTIQTLGEQQRFGHPIGTRISVREFEGGGFDDQSVVVVDPRESPDPEPLGVTGSTTFLRDDGTLVKRTFFSDGTFRDDTDSTQAGQNTITLTNPASGFDPASGGPLPGSSVEVPNNQLGQFAQAFQLANPTATSDEALQWAFGQMFPQPRGGTPRRDTQFIPGIGVVDLQTGDVIQGFDTPITDFQQAQLNQSQLGLNLDAMQFAQDFALRVQEFQQAIATTARQLDQTDRTIALREDELRELNRSNRTREALGVRQQIEVERENQRNHQINLGNLSLRGQELRASIEANRASVAGSNADRLFAASEAALDRSFGLLQMGLQDEQFRTAQRAELLDMVANAAQSPFDVVRQAAIASGGNVGISQALARGESGLTAQGLAPLEGLLDEFQGLRGPSPLLSGPLAQRIQGMGTAPQVPLPGLPGGGGMPGFGGQGLLTAGGAAAPPGALALNQQPVAQTASFSELVDFWRSRGLDPDAAVKAAGEQAQQELGGAFHPDDPRPTDFERRAAAGDLFSNTEKELLSLVGGDPLPQPGGAAEGEAIPLAGGGFLNNGVAKVGERGEELVVGGPFMVLNKGQVEDAGLMHLLHGGAPGAQTGGIFGTSFESAANTSPGAVDFLSFLRQQLVKRFAEQQIPITGRTGPVGVSAPGTPREIQELAAGFQASAGINPQSFFAEILRAAPPALRGGGEVRRTA